MAVDGTSIKSYIDNMLANKGYRGVRVTNVIETLKSVVDWVAAAVNSNLSTWKRSSDNSSGGDNTEDVYRTGITRFKGGIEAYTKTPDNKVMALVGNDLAAMRVSSQNGGPAFLEFHHPGIRIDKFGTDPDGILKFAPWSQAAAYALVIDSLTASFRLSNDLLLRKQVLFLLADNNHQFSGLGTLASILRYQIAATTYSHVFSVGTSATTSTELMRLQGDGRVGIGTAAPGFRLDVQVDNPTDGVLAQFQNTRSSGGNGALMQIHHAGVGIWRYGIAPGVDAFIIQGYGSGTFPERLRIDTTGNMGIGTNAPTAKLHLKGPTGYDQLRLENKYTPSGPGDANGQVGSVAWDDTWFYLKTVNGWRRMQLQSW